MTHITHNTWQNDNELTDYPLIHHNDITNTGSSIPTNLITDISINYLSNNEKKFYIQSITITEYIIAIYISDDEGTPVLMLSAKKPISSNTVYTLQKV